jgi:hypothetical protein
VTENLIEAIRASVADSASDEVRAAGAHACRALLAMLEPPPSPPPLVPQLPVAAIAAAVRSMPPEQLADLLIAKLRTLVPADAQAAPTNKFNIQLAKAPAP